MNTAEKFAYSVDEAISSLGISRAKLYEEIKQGRIRPFKVGTRTLFSPAALGEYVAAREAEARGPQAA